MSKKEKNLLFIVSSLVIFTLFWFLVYTPMEKKIAAKRVELEGLTAQLDQLNALYLQKEVYETEIAQMKEYIEKVETKFPGDMTQEMIIYTMISLENSIETLKIPSYTLYPPVVLASDGEYMPANSETPAYRENFIEVGTELSLETSYDDLKLMLAFFRDYAMDLSVENISMTSNSETDTITSNFTLNYYALRSLDKPFLPEDYFGPFEPKDDSIFSPYEGFGTTVVSDIEIAEITEIDDFVMNLSSINSDRSTVVIFKNGDIANDTYIYTDNEDNEPVEAVFENDGTNYFYRYKTSEVSYPTKYSERIPFTPGKFIDFKVYVEARSDADDKNGVEVTLINKTDLPLKVQVVGDDVTNPRFNLVSQTGTISVTNIEN